MKIRWRGHASFVIEAAGKQIVTDPFNAELGYPLKPIEADMVTVSHDHWDHNAVDTISGAPRLIKGIGIQDIDGITFKGIGCFHDRNQGRDRGKNTIFKITAEGINLVHLGDLGHTLTAAQIQEIGETDILFIPVGGKFTIDAAEAIETVQDLKPKIVIPMHFSTPHLSFALAPLEQFTTHFDRVIKKPALEITAEDLGVEMKVIVLDYLSS